MSDSVFDRAARLFLDARGMGLSQRDEFLDRECAGNKELRAEVDMLLAGEEKPLPFAALADELAGVRQRIDDEAQKSSPSAEARKVAGRSPARDAKNRIGPYKLLQKIGEGGFGVVYMAEQETPVRRQVALKIVKLGMDTKQVIARFEVEQQALAMMDHPNIARVFDAGVTDTGRPYFVMELVRGVPITEYCDTHQLSSKERIELFVPICRAVQHAHQKGIIHRDLKPSNILVTLHDSTAVPKIIDFGIAKALHQRLTEKTLFTEFRQFLGTPEYMSPEQAEMSGLDIDTRSDVYALGVVLYQLLVGTTPLMRAELRSQGFEGIQKIIREKDPPKPSTRMSTLASRRTLPRHAAPDANAEADQSGDTTTATELARMRKTDVPTLVRMLRGELDWVVMRCLEKDRTRRYESAGSLADDLLNFLDDRPVNAGPPSAAYRIKKIVKRHRGLVAAALTVFFAVLLGGAFAGWGFFEARRERDRFMIAEQKAKQSESQAHADAAAARAAEERERTARQKADDEMKRAEENAKRAMEEVGKSSAIAQFLRDMLSAADPSAGFGSTATVKMVLDQAAENLDRGALKNQPAVEAFVRTTVGQAYQSLGLYETAKQHLAKAVEIRMSISKDQPNAALADGYAELGTVLCRAEKCKESESHFTKALEIRRALYGEKSVEVARTHDLLAWSMVAFRHVEDARRHFQIALQLWNELGMEESAEIAEHYDLASTLESVIGNHGTAEAYATKSRGLREKIFGKESAEVAKSLSLLGAIAVDRRDIGAAKEFYDQAHDLTVRIFGPSSLKAALAQNDRAGVAYMMLDPKSAAASYAEVVAIYRRYVSTDNLAIGRILGNLAIAQRDSNQLEEAEKSARDSLRIVEMSKGDRNETLGTALNGLGGILLLRGKLDEAAERFESALSHHRSELTAPHLVIADDLEFLGRTRLEQGKYGEAVDLLKSASAMMALVSRDPTRLGLLKSATALALFKAGKKDEAKDLYGTTFIAPRADAVAVKVYRSFFRKHVLWLEALGREDEADELTATLDRADG